MQEKIIKIDKIDPKDFFGPNDRNIKTIKSNFPNLKIVARGDEIKVFGNSIELSDFEIKINKLINYYLRFENIEDNLIGSFLNNPEIDFETSKKSFSPILHGVNGRIIKAKTVNQRKIVDSIENNDLVFAVGPAGTGKTYTGIALAVKALKNKNVKRIILTRPAIEAGENLGFLPGDLKEKVDPYLAPFYDSLGEMISISKYKPLIADKVIEIIPLAFMRGRTLNNAFMILDEAQNATKTQMKMFLTRLGNNSKAIITGDTTQIDLPNNVKSGLVEVVDLLKNIDGIGFAHLTSKDVVRHKLVREIIDAYEAES